MGPVQAYKAFIKKLDSYCPIGYSSAGLVIGLGEDISSFSIGDRVLCAGSGANHSEVVAVPQILCVKLPAGVDLNKAAYNILGAIAFQGMRQAHLRLRRGLDHLEHPVCAPLPADHDRLLSPLYCG